MEKAILLDVDGILNTDRAIEIASTFDEQACPGFLIPESGDPVGARLINRACTITGAKIVICSSWLYTVGADYTLAWLQRTGIDGGLYHPDRTVFFGPDQQKRTAIFDWLKQHPGIAKESVVIVDDDRALNLGPLRRRQIIPDEADGILMRHFKRIIQLLGRSK